MGHVLSVGRLRGRGGNEGCREVSSFVALLLEGVSLGTQPTGGILCSGVFHQHC